MAKTLVIVESPAKAGTIKRYLGKGFQVLASYGHVRDLVPKNGAVDVDQNFAMRYESIDRNKKHMDQIIKAAQNADTLMLATDPDREGEAIAWHVLTLLQDQGKTDLEVQRVVFHAITKNAIEEAVKNPRKLSMELINAQQARRALDYLVGFHLSPLLWTKIRRGLSAGRVQSPALRLIVERELAIEAFVTQEYWTIHAQCHKDADAFEAKLIALEGKKLEQFSIQTKEESDSACQTLNQAAQGKLHVQTVEKKERKRRPSPPFITSTLQQEAAKKLGFSTSRTMRIAQQLYEGIDIGEQGRVGLITYMRTDSVTLAPEAIAQARDVITSVYGKDYLPDKPQTYQTKSKNAQEAHEAIRPASFELKPEELEASLSAEQLKLYRLIWQRAMASQMVAATLNTVAVTLACGQPQMGSFRANGSAIKHPGYLAAYQAGREDGDPKDNDEKWLPTMAEGDWIEIQPIEGHQHFTEPPPRYSEASLVKALEEFGIGRPSTYASIISTLQNREYVTLEKKRFHPTDVGRTVNQFLTNHFTQYVDYDFTAQLEDSLDDVSRGEQEWTGLLERFWKPFHQQVEHIDENVKRSDVTTEALDEACPECNHPLQIRLGRRGRFIGCSHYPECKYTRNVDGDTNNQDGEEAPALDRACPECQHPLTIKEGRYGRFIGCSNYPNCRHIEPLEQPKPTGVTCPTCKTHELVQKRSRRGKIFFGCSGYPQCQYATWNPPLTEPCPQCHWPILTLKTTKKGQEKVCPQKECGYKEALASSGETDAG